MSIIGKFIFSIFAGYHVIGRNTRSEDETSYTVAPNNRMSAQERAAILNLVNYKMRAIVSPPPCNLTLLNWNNDLQDALEKFVINKTGYAFFSTDHGFPQNPIVPYQKYNWLMYHLMKLPEFEKWKDTTIYITHDTQKNKPMSVYKIFQFRERQRSCFVYANCSNGTYSNFDSCIPPEFNYESPIRKCHYASNFYIRLLTAFDNIACVKTGVPGPFTPTEQPNGFVCYGSTKNVLVFSNDIPYKKCVKRASECSKDYTAYKGLCNKVGG